MFQKKIRAIFKPDLYHGWGKTKSYFEGWYYKVLTKDEKYAFAIIPGIAMDAEGKKQAFIQILDGNKLSAQYFKFDADLFTADSKKFKVNIDTNRFEINNISLDLPKFKGHLTFKQQIPWPNRWYSPGIMGPYTFVPFMECYHGILSMDHEIQGVLEIDGERIDFSDGRGYIEKDWGHSFPSAYIWMQSNHFSQPGISLKASVAKIPWLRSSFVGFIAGLYFDKKLIEFTTYNGSHLIRSNANETEVELILENKKYRLEINVYRNDSTILAAPIQGFMDGRISESMTSVVDVKLFHTKNDEIIFEDRGRNVALEVAGNLPEILIG